MNRYRLFSGLAPAPAREVPAPADRQAMAVRQLMRAARLNELRYRVTGIERVALGDQVTLYSLDDAARYMFEIVEPCLADPHRRRISCFSPLGAALLGRRRGESLSVMTLGRQYDFLLLEMVRNPTCSFGEVGHRLASDD